MAKRICLRCLNDESVRGIQFDDQGICSYCRAYEQWQPRLNDYPALHALWLERVNKYRGQGAYDVLVGISGGKDSTYVLHQLLYRYRLRVRTFTFDNGFLSDWARDRIAKVVQEFGVEHSYLAHPHEQLSRQYRHSIALSGAPCTACSILVYASTLALAHELDIPMAVHGRSRPQMFRYFARDSHDPFVPFIYAALSPVDEVDLTALYADIEARINQAFGHGLIEMARSWSPNFTIEQPAEFVPFFLYHPYDERSIVEFLESNTQWRRPSNYDLLTHHDCDAHDAAAYLYAIAEGRPHLLPELSVMIREGAISREEAAERLKAESFAQRPETSLAHLASFVELDADELEKQAHRLAQHHKNNAKQ